MMALALVALLAGGAEQEIRTVPFHINFSTLGLGPVIPSTVEIDGNPLTTEWMLTSTKESKERWIFNPLTYCVSAFEPVPPDNLNYNPAMEFVFSIVRIGLVDKAIITDINDDDDFMPAKIYDITSPCYPKQ